MKQQGETTYVSGQWPLSAYKWKTESFFDKYVEGLKQKKIKGIRCIGCGHIYVPPNVICCKCRTRLRLERDEDWIQVSEIGRILSYTISHMDILPGGLKERKKEDRIIYALVQLDGTDTHIFVEVRNSSEQEVKIGMRVRAVWVDEPKGTLGDISHFVPAS